MPHTANHKSKISKGVKAYHACARSKGCGKGKKKKSKMDINTFYGKKKPKKKMKKQGPSDRTNEKQGEEIMELKKKVANKKLIVTYNQFKKTPEGKKWIEKRESAMGSYYAPNLKDYWNNTRLQKGATSLEYIKNAVDRVLKANKLIGMFKEKKPVAKKAEKPVEDKIYQFDWWYGGKDKGGLNDYLNDTMDSSSNGRRIGYKRVESATKKILNEMKKQGVKPTQKSIIDKLNKKFPSGVKPVVKKAKAKKKDDKYTAMGRKMFEDAKKAKAKAKKPVGGIASGIASLSDDTVKSLYARLKKIGMAK